MFKVLIPAAAALGLVAFAAQSREAVAPVAEHAPMGWHLSHEGAMAKLAYGVANSDMVALMLTCSPGDQEAAAYGPALPAGARLVRASLSAPAEIDPMTGDLMRETKVSLDDTALAGLVRHGRLAVQAEGDVGVLKATAAERRMIGDVLAYCAAHRI